MNDPVLSIIIPYYNAGEYLPEALESIKAYPDKNAYEVIIVNDGSNDESSIRLLTQLSKEDYIIIHQENSGPAAARNAAVKISKGKYLLLLDSDNKIRSNYIYKGLEILNTQADIGIVYGNPAFFGETIEPSFHTGEFDMAQMLKGNYIDTCSIIRKTLWEAIGGQDEDRMAIAHEDWDFWIRAGAAGYKFHYVNETVFDYRNADNSLLKQFIEPDILQLKINYLYCKHASLVYRHYNILYNQFYFYQIDQQKPFRSFFKFIYNKYVKKS